MKRLLLFIAFVCSASLVSMAQCAIDNTAFQGGEQLDYKLYFNWKFVWVNAGTATLSTKDTTWEGKPAYKSHLITRSSARVDRFFRMRDTLQCITSKQLVPFQYKKAADEGGRYYVDKVWYTYPGGGVTHLQHEFTSADGKTSRKQTDMNECVYDMMSMMQRARSFRASDYREGQHIRFPMADGKKVENITLVYRGKKNMSMRSGGTTYRCLIISFVEYENGQEKEIITFYITDDENHLPVRLDMFLKFGTAKAYLERTSGLRSPMRAIVKE